MAERKVLNKYIPPDFDPSKLPRGKKAEFGQAEVRMMLPFSVQCNTCGEFMYKGKKFNSKKEDVVNETYLGIKIYRFIMKCTTCSALFAIKTDPKNLDYAMEYGAKRNFEPWRDSLHEQEEKAKEKEEEEKSDALKALETRTLDSKRQMEAMDELEEIKARRIRQAKLGPEEILQTLHSNEPKSIEETSVDPSPVEPPTQPLLKRIRLSTPTENNNDNSTNNSFFPSKITAPILKKPIVVEKPQAAPIVSLVAYDSNEE